MKVPCPPLNPFNRRSDRPPLQDFEFSGSPANESSLELSPDDKSTITIDGQENEITKDSLQQASKDWQLARDCWQKRVAERDLLQKKPSELSNPEDIVLLTSYHTAEAGAAFFSGCAICLAISELTAQGEAQLARLAENYQQAAKENATFREQASDATIAYLDAGIHSTWNLAKNPLKKSLAPTGMAGGFVAAEAATASRLGLDDSFLDAIVKLSEGLPGATAVLNMLAAQCQRIDPAAFVNDKEWGPLMTLDDKRIYGERIWKFYRGVCKNNVASMLACLRATSFGIINDQTLNEAIDGKKAIDVDTLMKQVQERLPNFNSPNSVLAAAPRETEVGAILKAFATQGKSVN